VLQSSEEVGSAVVATAKWAEWTRLWFVLNSVDSDKFAHYRSGKFAAKLEAAAEEASGGGGADNAEPTEAVLELNGDVAVDIATDVPIVDAPAGATARERELGAYQNVFKVKHVGGDKRMWELQAGNKAGRRYIVMRSVIAMLCVLVATRSTLNNSYHIAPRFLPTLSPTPLPHWHSYRLHYSIWADALAQKQKIALKSKLKKFRSSAADSEDSDDEVDRIEKEEEQARADRAVAMSNAGKVQGWSFNKSTTGATPPRVAAAPPPWAAKPVPAPASSEAVLAGTVLAGAPGQRKSVAAMIAEGQQEDVQEGRGQEKDQQREGVVFESLIVKKDVGKEKDVTDVQKWLVLARPPRHDGQAGSEERGSGGLTLFCLQSFEQAKQMAFWGNTAASIGYESIVLDDKVKLANSAEGKQWRVLYVEEGETKPKVWTLESADHAEMMKVHMPPPAPLLLHPHPPSCIHPSYTPPLLLHTPPLHTPPPAYPCCCPPCFPSPFSLPSRINRPLILATVVTCSCSG
jgi:hypothetical protein